MEWTTVGALGSAISAAAAIGAAIVATRKTQEVLAKTQIIQKHTLNSVRLAQAEAMLDDHLEEILELHGRSRQDIQKLGISRAQLVYLIHSFSGGDVYYRVGDDKHLTPYRMKLLESKKVRDAWADMLRGVFVNSDGQFAQLVDAHIVEKYPADLRGTRL